MQHTMTFDIFCFRLGRKYPLRTCRGYTAGRRLKNIRLSGDGCIDRHYLYLLSWDEYSADPGRYTGCAVLLFQMPEDRTLPQGNIVVLPKIDGIKGLINDALVIFAEFEEWHEKLHEADEKGLRPEQMFGGLIGYMQMEIAIADNKNDFYYISVKKSDDPMGIFEMSPEEVRAILNTQKEFPESFYTHDVELYPDLYNGLLYYYNFFLEGGYLARLLGVFPDGPFASGQLRLFRYVTKYAERLYILHYKDGEHDRKGKRFILAMKNLLQAKKIHPQILQNILDIYDWKIGDMFQVLKFKHENLMENPAYLDFLCASIEEQFPSCCALGADQDVFCVRDLSLEEDPGDFDQNMAVFLRENLCNVGMSNVRRDIVHLPMLADEAGDALEHGLQNHPMRWSFHFSDCVLDHLRDAMTAKYDVEELEHNAVGILRRYDREHNSCLEETLRVFTIQRFSASAAANAMYIHRSTFLHRLRRIQELTSLNFENEREREWLTLSFFLRRSGTP